MKNRILSFALALALCLGLTAPALAAAQTFTDVPASYWAYDAIERAYAGGIVNGTSYDQATGARTYSPENSLTLAHFVVMLTRAFYGTEVERSSATGAWYAKNLAAAKAHGLLDGLGAYSMDATATRYQMASIMAAIMEDKGAAMPSGAELAKAQGQIGDWTGIPQQYQDAVAAVFALGIIQGTDSKGTFAGEATVKRSHAAVIYGRLADAIEALSGTERGQTSATAPNEETDSVTVSVADSTVEETPAQSEKPVKPSTAEKPTEDIDLSALQMEMLRLVNAERAKEGLPALQLDERVCEYAQIRAAEVTEKRSHTRPNGENYWTELERMGVVYYPGGENISVGEDNPADAVNGWMHSPGHRANILKEGIKGFAMGYVQIDSGYKHYWVQIFTGAVSPESKPSGSTVTPTDGTSQNNGGSGGTSGNGSGNKEPEHNTPNGNAAEKLTTATAQSQLLTAINNERANAGLAPLVLDAQASEAAQVRAAEQIDGANLTRPDGRPFETALEEAGVSYQTACECLISGQGTADKIMNSITGYSKFRDNMLSGDVSKVGIGFTRSNTEWPYCSIIFYS